MATRKPTQSKPPKGQQPQPTQGRKQPYGSYPHASCPREGDGGRGKRKLSRRGRAEPRDCVERDGHDSNQERGSERGS